MHSFLWAEAGQVFRSKLKRQITADGSLGEYEPVSLDALKSFAKEIRGAASGVYAFIVMNGEIIHSGFKSSDALRTEGFNPGTSRDSRN